MNQAGIGTITPPKVPLQYKHPFIGMKYQASPYNGLKAYLNGEELATEVEQDHLYKDILFDSKKEELFEKLVIENQAKPIELLMRKR